MSDNELLQKVATDIAVLKTAILGNGTIGLAERMTTVEAWVNTHPRECPLAQGPRLAIWTKFSIATAFVIGLGGVATAVIALLGA